MPIKGFSSFSSGGHFVQWSKTILVSLVEGHLRNISIYFEIGPLANEKIAFNGFSFFSSGGHFMQPSGKILAHMVEGQPRNISVKLFENWSIGLGVDII